MKSKDLIVIATSPGRENWVREILSSISRPSIVISDFGFELGKLRWVFENTNADRFLFLQDSVVIRDERFFDRVFEAKGSACFIEGSTCLNGFMGLYERAVLNKLAIPVVNDKEDSIRYEVEWTKEYIEACGHLEHPIPISQKKFETVRKFGRENLVLVSPYFEKWYGTWAAELDGEKALRLAVQEQTDLEKSRAMVSLIRENIALRKSLRNRAVEALRAFRSRD